jgi:hypothetical protein
MERRGVFYLTAPQACGYRWFLPYIPWAVQRFVYFVCFVVNRLRILKLSRGAISGETRND